MMLLLRLLLLLRSGVVVMLLLSLEVLDLLLLIETWLSGKEFVQGQKRSARFSAATAATRLVVIVRSAGVRCREHHWLIGRSILVR
jgi:hypothetical protein